MDEFECEYCNRVLKSKAGLMRHLQFCKVKSFKEDTEEVYTDVEPEVVQLEVMGTEESDYLGHPNRIVKLRGLLSRTFDKNEKHRIHRLIMELSKGR